MAILNFNVINYQFQLLPKVVKSTNNQNFYESFFSRDLFCPKIAYLEVDLVFKIYACCDFIVLVFQDKETCIDHYIDIKFCVMCWNHMSSQIFAK